MNPDLQVVPRLNGHFRLQWEPAQDCYVLLYPEGMVKLNGSAGLILSNVDGQRSLGSIIEELSRQFPDVESISEDVVTFIKTARAQRWIEVDDAAS